MAKARYVAGLRAVEQLLASRAAEILRLYAEYRSVNPRVAAVLERAEAQGVEIRHANRARLEQLSGEPRHQGVVAEIRRSSALDEAALRTLIEARLADAAAPPLLILVLDGVQDPHNLGAVLRTADAAGADAVVVPRHGVAGLSPAVSKVAAGAAETVPFASVANVARVLSWLGNYGVRIVGTSDDASGSLFDADLTGPLALVMGGEHAGLRQAVRERVRELVSLPMRGKVASLNVSVAAGVCLYECLRQRRASSRPGA